MPAGAEVPAPVRCPWCSDDPLAIDYHDREWGVPVHDERRLFEMLTLEGAQAGLSWMTILRKRPAYRAAFEVFDPERVARFDAARIDALAGNPGIVRNRAKIASTVGNARAVLELRDGVGLPAFLWAFVDGRQIDNRRVAAGDVPAQTAASRRMAKALRTRGFRFCGPVICYALMQAVGMVNDHLVGCFRHAQIAAAQVAAAQQSAPQGASDG